MYEEPYRWVEAVANRRQYLDDQFREGSPVVGLAYDGGVLLLTVSKGTPKLYEIYDRLALGGMGSGFITLAAVSRWQVPDSAAGIYTLSYLVGQTVGNLAFGFLSDRLGHKICLEVGALAGAAAFALAWLAPAPGWYYAVFVLAGIAAGAIVVSGILIVMEFSEPARRPTYVGIANTAVGLVSAIGPLLGAGLAKISYGWLFALSALVHLVAFGAFRWWVTEPRGAPELNARTTS